MTIAALLLGGLLLAYANGANDNFKGVATLLGSGSAEYRRALIWATLTTFLGSLVAIFAAGELLQRFSGKGLVVDTLARRADFAAAVALGAGATVLLASRVGMPISTTHGLVGALIGAGWAAGGSVAWSKLGGGFLLPLLTSPLVAIVGATVIYPPLSLLRRRCGITRQTCLCVGNRVIEAVPLGPSATYAVRTNELSLQLGESVVCQNRYRGSLVGIHAVTALNGLHFTTAGAVCFARGLNDTPKIAALLLAGPFLGDSLPMLATATAIAIGGVLHGRRVAETMSKRITAMNSGQGCSANLVSSAVVVGASFLGMPVSTTHVSCGSLFGIGAVTRQADWRMVKTIVAAWLLTLPCGMVMGAVGYRALQLFAAR